MDYQLMLEIAETTITEKMTRHINYPLNGYQDNAEGVKTMWHICALKSDLERDVIANDLKRLNSIIWNEIE